MEFKWVITPHNVGPYKDFVDRHKHLEFVRKRIEKNVRRGDVAISKERFWERLVGCLLTTQQRSGPNSHLSRYLDAGGPLVDMGYCLKRRNLAAFAANELSAAGIRRNELIGAEIEHAAAWIHQNGWISIKHSLEPMRSHTTFKKERSAARFLQEHFKGVGPKQSRNLLQALGLTRYEIPIDSRVVKVLKTLSFPIPLSSQALSDEEYYCFVEDGLRELLSSIEIYPCVFDACAFASFDNASTPSTASED